VIKLPREGQFWLLAIVILFAAGWMKGINLILLLTHLMVCLIALNWIIAFRQVRGLRAERRAPALLFAGEECTWDVLLTNNRERASHGIVLNDSGMAHDQQIFVARLEEKSEVHLGVRQVFPNRGRYSLRAISVECLYPFGLTGRERVVGGAEEWVILPQLGRLNAGRFRRWLATTARGDGRIHRLARPSMIRQDDLHGLRPFRLGDSPRWIHWRTSARRNQRMVREFEEAAGQNLVIVFDTWSPKPGPPASSADFEDAVSLAAAVCNEWCSQRQDQLVLAVAGATPTVLSGYTCRATLVQMLRRLAITSGEADYLIQPLLSAASKHRHSDSPVLVIGARKKSPLVSGLALAWHRPVLCLTADSAREFYEPPRATIPPTAVRETTVRAKRG